MFLLSLSVCTFLSLTKEKSWCIFFTCSRCLFAWCMTDRLTHYCHLIKWCIFYKKIKTRNFTKKVGAYPVVWYKNFVLVILCNQFGKTIVVLRRLRNLITTISIHSSYFNTNYFLAKWISLECTLLDHINMVRQRTSFIYASFSAAFHATCNLYNILLCAIRCLEYEYPCSSKTIILSHWVIFHLPTTDSFSRVLVLQHLGILFVFYLKFETENQAI